MEEALSQLIIASLDQGITVSILIGAFVYRDKQANIERIRSDDKYNQLFEILEKLTDKLNGNIKES